jgi:hypothetical protein
MARGSRGRRTLHNANASTIRRASGARRFPDTDFPVLEAIRRAEAWWDKKGRHICSNPEWSDPDVGIKSGITRGLPWENLSAKERARVIAQWHHEYVRAPMVHQGGLSEGDLRELWHQTQGRRK